MHKKFQFFINLLNNKQIKNLRLEKNKWQRNTTYMLFLHFVFCFFLSLSTYFFPFSSFVLSYFLLFSLLSLLHLFSRLSISFQYLAVLPFLFAFISPNHFWSFSTSLYSVTSIFFLLSIAISHIHLYISLHYSKLRLHFIKFPKPTKFHFSSRRLHYFVYIFP